MTIHDIKKELEEMGLIVTQYGDDCLKICESVETIESFEGSSLRVSYNNALLERKGIDWSLIFDSQMLQDNEIHGDIRHLISLIKFHYF